MRLRLNLAVAVLATASSVCAQGVMTTVAGNGSAAFLGDGGPATQASFSGPAAVVLDAAGNLYIFDSGNYRIRKVSANGIVTTIGGNGSAGFNAIGNLGDGGPATSASIGAASVFPGIAVDGAGNVYFSDSGNHRVRKIDTAGIVKTFAGNGFPGFSGDGGPAISAAVFNPLGLAIDGAGNLYIADASNARVRRVDTAGMITTVAGSGRLGPSGDGGPAIAAGFNAPTGLAIDGAGNLYISDMTSQHIRKVDRSGLITTVAGSGTAGFAGDGGAATGARFSGLRGLAVDRSGNLYIVDRNNQRIRRVDAAGVITTAAGSGTSGFAGDGGPATAAGIALPNDVALDAAGNLYIADFNNHRIRKVLAAPAATPAILPNGVVHGATLQPGIVPNSWGAILGTNLSSTTTTWDDAIVNGNLPTTLGGVSVTVSGRPAYLYYVSPTQINFITPDIAPSSVAVTVTNSGATSAAFTVVASPFGPAFFPWPNGQAVATRQDFSYAARNGTFPGTVTVPARPGEVIILWGTGFGPTTPAAPAGVLLPADRTYATSTLPTVTINNIPATVYGAALAPGFAGLYQVAIQVPNSIPDGDWPVVATIGGVSSPAAAMLSVGR